MKSITMILVTLAATFATTATLAQTMPTADGRAKALYDAAVKELDATGPARACPMFAEVVTLAPESWGGWMMLGECRKREGKLASAYRAYSTASEVARRVGHIGRSEQAAKKAAELEAKLARLSIELSDEVRRTPEVEVLVDGKPVIITENTTTLPVDRGDHVVEVKAKNQSSLKRVRSLLVDGARATVQIDKWLSPKKKRTNAVTKGTDEESVAEVPKAPAGLAGTRATPTSIPKWQRTAGWITASVGGAAIVGGSIAGLVAISRRDESNDGHCDRDQCDREGLALRQGSLQAGSVSTGLFVAGGLLTAVGITAFFVPLQKKQTVGLHIGPTTIEVRGAF